MIEMIVSGGQTGVDQSAWRAARRLGLPTGGWMPKGFRTERGNRPEFAKMYGAKEAKSSDYPFRTKLNVEMSDVTLWFGQGDSSGYWCTKNCSNKCYKSFMEIGLPSSITSNLQVKMIFHAKWKILNIAGNRGSRLPDGGLEMEERIFDFLSKLKDIYFYEGLCESS